jgi:hypothetical protein
LRFIALPLELNERQIFQSAACDWRTATFCGMSLKRVVAAVYPIEAQRFIAPSATALP